jgi:hypothetical protein
MKRFLWKVGVATGTSLFMGAVISACAHNDASIFIRQVFLPVIPSNGECTFTADPTQAAESVGAADVSFANLRTYSPEVLIGNQIISQGNADMEQAETSRVFVYGAITRITDLAGDDLQALFLGMGMGGDTAAQSTYNAVWGPNPTITPPINPFSTVEASAIDPATGATATYAVLGLTMVDGQTVAIIRNYFETLITNGDLATALGNSIQLLTYTKIEGTTEGGDSEESNDFEFPVTFSYGGLVSNLISDPASVDGFCLDVAITLPSTAQTCVYGQDIPVIVGSLNGVPDCVIAVADAGGGGLTDAGLGD